MPEDPKDVLRRVDRARTDLAYFAQTYLGTDPAACGHLSKPHIRAPFGPVQRDQIGLLEDDSVRQLLFIAPRKWAKTTIGSLVFPLWLLAFEPRLGHMVFGGVSTDQPKEDLKTLKDELTRNELFIHDFGQLAATGERWQIESIRVYRWWDLDKPPEKRRSVLVRCVSPKSKGGGLRGSKAGSDCPQIIILNDAQRTEYAALRDPGQRAEYEFWFHNVMRPSRDPAWSRILVFENLVGQASVAGKLIAGVPFSHPDGGTYGRCDPELAAENVEWTRRKWQMSPGGVRFERVGGREVARINGENTWPEHYSNEWLERDRLAGQPRAVIASEYQNDPVAPGMQVFSHVPRYPGPPPADGADARRRWPGMIIEAAVDPASSQSRSADYTAVVTVGRVVSGEEKGNLYVLHHEERKLGAVQEIEWVLSLHERWGWRQLYWETQSAQRRQYEHAVRFARERGVALRFVDVTRGNTENKHARISFLEPYLRDGTVKIAAEKDGGLYATITEYHEHVAHDDVLDALETVATRLLKSVASAPVTTGGRRSGGGRNAWIKKQLDRSAQRQRRGGLR